MRLHVVIAVLAQDFLQAFGAGDNESVLIEQMSKSLVSVVLRELVNLLISDQAVVFNCPGPMSKRQSRRLTNRLCPISIDKACSLHWLVITPITLLN
jgi:phage FluMu protein gp41